MVRHAAREYGVKALGVTLSRQQAQWAKEAIDREGLGDLAEVRHLDYRDVAESDFDAVSSIGLTEHIGVRNYPAYFSLLRDRLRPEGRLLNHCITRPHNHRQEIGAFLDRYVFPDGELIGSGRIITEAQNVGLEVMHEENLRRHYALTLAGWCRNLGELGRVRRRGRRGHRPGLGPLHGRVAARLRAQRDPAAPGARRAPPSRRRRLPASPHLVSCSRRLFQPRRVELVLSYRQLALAGEHPGSGTPRTSYAASSSRPICAADARGAPGSPGSSDRRSRRMGRADRAGTVPDALLRRPSWDGRELVLDVVVHDLGLVTEWAAGDCVGGTVTISEPRGLVRDAGRRGVAAAGRRPDWMPAMARITATTITGGGPVTARIWVETPDEPIGYVRQAGT